MSKMTKTQAAQAVAAIDWNFWVSKIPALADLLLKLIDLLKQPQPMGASAHCDVTETMRQCLSDQEAALLTALVHNCHMKQCCCHCHDEEAA